MAEKDIKIEGMSCHHCVMALRKSFTMVPGVTDADVEVGRARVTYDEAKVTDEALAEAVTRAGFKVRPF